MAKTGLNKTALKLILTPICFIFVNKQHNFSTFFKISFWHQARGPGRMALISKFYKIDILASGKGSWAGGPWFFEIL